MLWIGGLDENFVIALFEHVLAQARFVFVS